MSRRKTVQNYSESRLGAGFDDSACSESSQESDYDPESAASYKNVHQIITDEMRKMFLTLINIKGMTIAKAARKAGLRYSTAKTIYSRNKAKAKAKALEAGETLDEKVYPTRQKVTTKVSKSRAYQEDFDGEEAGESQTAEKKSSGAKAPALRKKVKLTNDNEPTEFQQSKEISAVDTLQKMDSTSTLSKSNTDDKITVESVKCEHVQETQKLETQTASPISLAASQMKLLPDEIQRILYQRQLLAKLANEALAREQMYWGYVRMAETMRGVPYIVDQTALMMNMVGSLRNQIQIPRAGTSPTHNS